MSTLFFMITEKTILKFIITILFCLLFLLTIPLKGQNNTDYISDWYYIFFSQNDLISLTKHFHLNYKNINEKEKIILNSSFSFNDFYREKSENLNRNAHYWQQFNELTIPVYILGQNLSINAYSQFVSKQIDYDINSLENFEITHNSKKYFISLSAPIWKDYISLLTGIGTRIQNGESKINYQLGIQFSLNNENVITFLRYTDFFIWKYEIGFQNPVIKLNVLENTQMNELNLRLQLIPNLSLAGLMQNNYINKDQKIDNKKTTYLPTGIWYRRQMKVNYVYRKSWMFGFKYNNRESNLLGYFYERKQSFGKITISNDFSEMYNPGISYTFNQHTLGINFTWGKGYLANRGHIESWPFTSTWVDLLGLRYNFNSRIDFKLKRYGIKYKFKKTDWTLALHSSYELLNPSGETRTWEPEFLVFGIKNLKIYDVEHLFQSGLYLSVNFSKEFGEHVDIFYSFSQYIPIKSKISGQAEQRLTMDREKTGNVYGGGKHQIKFAFYF